MCSYMELHIATYSYMYIHTARCICMELDIYTWSYVYIQAFLSLLDNQHSYNGPV